ncbi:hypothetical protein D3C84_383010 [compost metagenome]
MGFLIVRAEAGPAGHVGLVQQQGFARSSLGVEPHQLCRFAYAIAVDTGRQQVADHPFVPGQRIDLVAGLGQQASGPVDAALVGGIVDERAIDEPGAGRHGDAYAGFGVVRVAAHLPGHAVEDALVAGVVRVVEVRFVGKADVVRALAAKRTCGGEPGIEAGVAGGVGAQVGLALTAGQQGDVLSDAQAILIQPAEHVFVMRPRRHDVDQTVIGSSLWLQGIEHGETGIRQLRIGQGDTQVRGLAEHVVVQRQPGLAFVFAQGLELLRVLGEQVGRAIEPECDLATTAQVQAPDLIGSCNGQLDFVELPIGGVRL